MYRLMNKLIMIRKYHQFYLKGRPNHVAPFDHWKLFQLVSACIYHCINFGTDFNFTWNISMVTNGVPLSKTGYLTSRGEAGEVGIIVTLPLRCTIRGICSKQRCFLNFKGTVYEEDSCV
jgi:hypothetical protein